MVSIEVGVQLINGKYSLELSAAPVTTLS